METDCADILYRSLYDLPWRLMTVDLLDDFLKLSDY